MALAEIRRHAVAGRIVYTRHAIQRMGERGAHRADVREALCGASSCKVGSSVGTWVVCGRDRDGDDLDVVVAVEAGLIVVTLF